MSDFKLQISRIKHLEAQFEEQFDQMLREAMLECFMYWAKRFPKRRLRVVFGMGGYSYDAGDFDLDQHISYDRKGYHGWHDKFEEILKPFREFEELMYSSEYVKFPAIEDFLYSPDTGTIEYGNTIIYIK